MGKKEKDFPKGTLVYVRETWGEKAGQVDERNLYVISAIGPKQVTLKCIDKTTGQVNSFRGYNYYKMSREEAEQSNIAQQGQSYRRLNFWDWAQFLVPQGELGWDAPQNY